MPPYKNISGNHANNKFQSQLMLVLGLPDAKMTIPLTVFPHEDGIKSICFDSYFPFHLKINGSYIFRLELKVA